MVVGAFPLAKLGFVLVKQISKPIASGIANRARKSRLFRHYICIPIAQVFHWYDVKIRMQVLNLGKVTSVQKLDEKKAIETGAQLLSEFILVAVASGIVIFEYRRSSEKEDKKQQEIEMEKEETRKKILNLEFDVARQAVQIMELTRLAIAIRDDVQNLSQKSEISGAGNSTTPSIPRSLQFDDAHEDVKLENVSSNRIMKSVGIADEVRRLNLQCSKNCS